MITEENVSEEIHGGGEAENQVKRCGNCDNECKYKCPACGERSCSLECVRMHKVKTGCDGNYLSKHISRNIAISQYTIGDLAKDRAFLQDVQRGIAEMRENSSKGRKDIEFKGIKRSDKHKYFEDRTRCKRLTPIALLRKACNKRNIKISFCPVDGMQIRKQNTTYYDKKNDRLYWKIEFSICKRGDGEESSVTSKNVQIENVSEEERVSEILRKIVDNLGNSNMCYLCSSENLIELDINKTFRENFSGKRIIEFPRIKVVVYT
ncbi:hypothetical protein FG386_001166 [Cryptosporidium ryanae]|uniref:uncharacterized protein n=1 Tax=Cryptosporidium ryanae TaxID=515981 RepID=UPI00351A0610|nr:hypothetical protein FG386_001166 [Cryptosporidium ryanae]